MIISSTVPADLFVASSGFFESFDGDYSWKSFNLTKMTLPKIYSFSDLVSFLKLKSFFIAPVPFLPAFYTAWSSLG